MITIDELKAKLGGMKTSVDDPVTKTHLTLPTKLEV